MGLHPPCHSHLVVGGLGSAPLVSGGLYGGVLDGVSINGILSGDEKGHCIVVESPIHGIGRGDFCC
jgi:hypothetical protein